MTRSDPTAPTPAHDDRPGPAPAGAAAEEPSQAGSGLGEDSGTAPARCAADPAGDPGASGAAADEPSRSGGVEGRGGGVEAAPPGPAGRAQGGGVARRVPELGAMELLVAVARLGSLGRAARELGISQPAASGRMRGLERQLGVALVRRSPGGSTLTDSGALVTEWARRVLEAAEDFDAGARALRGQRDSRLRVAASMTVAEYLLPGWLTALHARHPGTAVSLAAGNSVVVAQQVTAGKADLGFVEGLDVPAALDAAVIGHDRLLVVVAPGHPWASRRTPLPAAELAGTPLLLREEGSGTRQVLDAGLAAHGGPAVPLLELASTTAVKSAAVGGAGPAVLSGLAVADELSARRLVEVPVAGIDLRRALRAVWPAGHRPAGPARDLLALTRRTASR